jgi:Amt family ammonium transporter
LLWHAAVIGAIGAIFTVFAVGFFDKLKIDDPVGAISVHLVNGVWGTLAVGLFAMGDGNAPGVSPLPGFLYAGPLGLFNGGGFASLWTQFLGTICVGGFVVAASSICWIVLKLVLGIRVEPEEELKGLDIGEHGMEAYSGFLKDQS